MKTRLLAAVLPFLLALVAGDGSVARAQTDGVEEFLRRLEKVVRDGDASRYVDLLSASVNVDRARAFAENELPTGLTRVVLQERDRRLLIGRGGAGYRLVVDAFQQANNSSRVATWQIDIERADMNANAAWVINDVERITSLEGLHNLSLNPARQYSAKQLTIAAEDLELTVADGSAFVAETDDGDVTAMVVIGRGEMRFRPSPATEKVQVRIFSGEESIDTRFDALYLRFNPIDFESLVATEALVSRPVDAGDFRRADEVFRNDWPKSFGVDLGDLSPESWALTPNFDDVLVEIHTRRFDTLTYVRQTKEPEDISLFDRKRHHNIAVYASKRKLADAGYTYDDWDRGEYDVLDYDIDVAVTPDRRWIAGRAKISARARANGVKNLTFRLADTLAVQSVVSAEFGPLSAVRVKAQESVVINLPSFVKGGTVLTLTISYAGRLEPKAPDREMAAPPQDLPPSVEPSLLYSSGTYWYPQTGGTDYATATMRITVPGTFECVASGEAAEGSPTWLDAKELPEARKQFVFRATQPLRYLGFVISRFVRADSRVVTGPARFGADQRPEQAGGAWYDDFAITVEANPREAWRGRFVGERAAEIATFYRTLLDDFPYPSFTIALIENTLPGGHSPAYFAVVHQPVSDSPFVWRNDPASFNDYPDFFLAHELAHQWWGQAVGWRNYHEQWISEGFAQYFATLYARAQYGDEVFTSVMRQMRKWAIDQSDQGPIFLGYRLGHIRNDSRVMRALVYNKSAIVLHMLRSLVGDEAFFSGLRSFYRESRFQKVGTADFQAAMEAASGQPLERFFDRWIYGSTIPRVRFSYRVDGPDVVLHAEQVGEIFDLPLTVTLQFADRRSTEVTLLLTEQAHDLRVPLSGTLRGADISKDDGALFEIVK